MPQIKFVGDMSMSAEPDVRRRLLQDLRTGTIPLAEETVTVDLSGVTHIDGSGLAHLVELAHLARKAGQRVVLRGAKGQVVRMIELAKLNGIFDFAPTSPHLN